MEEKMEKNEEEWHLYPIGSTLGMISINPDVIARIAQQAIAQVEGVELASRKNILDNFSILTKGPKDAVKGIHMEQNETGRYAMQVDVRICYGKPMQELAERTQRTIKDGIEAMTGYSLERVDIRIVDIFDEPEPREREKEREEEED